MAMKTVSQLTMAFMGVSTLRYKETSAKLIPTQEWDYEFPVLRDSVNFTQGEISRNQAFIHGSSRAYATAAGEPASTTLTFFVPSINADVQKAFGNTASGTPATLKDGTGYWKPVGSGVNLTEKQLSGMAMLISQDKKYALVIKNLEGYASVQFDAPSTKPLGYNVSFDVSGITENDTDGDVVLYEYSTTS
jgi:hypothetical protein